MERWTAVCLGICLLIVSLCEIAECQWCRPNAATNSLNRCCSGRQDECSVPFYGTRCYCDEFCNRQSPDCCPDFTSVCLGIAVTTERPGFVGGCYAEDGTFHFENAEIKINCNKCYCRRTGPIEQPRFEFQCDQNPCLIRPYVIDAVNQPGQNGWQASNYTFFWGLTMNEGVSYRLGTLSSEDYVMGMKPIHVDTEQDVPENFDSRDKFLGQIHGIRDQGNCAASWAFSTADVASDRLTIQSMGQMDILFSPQQLLSCNTDNQRGCDGGYLDRAWWYTRRTGVVTESCYPYTSGETDNRGQCLINTRGQITCPTNAFSVANTLYQTTPPYRLPSDDKSIMIEIMKNGPVQATFKVKEDFFMYKSGVYRHTNYVQGGEVGLHSVRIIGWGSQSDIYGRQIKYWLCANSWGRQWGEDGYFKIVRGENECGIEEFALGVWGNIDSDMLNNNFFNFNQVFGGK